MSIIRQGTGQPPFAFDPSGERPPAGPGTDRDAGGRFLPGNVAALKHGARRSLDAPDLAEAVLDVRASFVAHLGGEPSLTPTKALLVDSAARCTVLADGAFNAMLAAGGPITGKGRRRAIFDVWDRLDEKVAKRMERLGLERTEKHVDLAAAFKESAR